MGKKATSDETGSAPVTSTIPTEKKCASSTGFENKTKPASMMFFVGEPCCGSQTRSVQRSKQTLCMFV